MTQHALELSQGIACTYIMACAQRVLGRLAQATGATTIADEHFRQALHTFTTLQTRYEVARTHLLLAELAQVQGERDLWTMHLTAAQRLFQHLHVPHYVTRTEQLCHLWSKSR